MTRSKRLGPVARLAQSREHEASRQLGLGQKTLRDQQASLDELKGYYDEHSRRFLEALAGGLGGAAMQQYRGFLTRLSRAIDSQAAVIAGTERELDARRRAWLEQRARAAALGKVLEGCRESERRERSRREQRQLDEHGARRCKPQD